MEQVIILSDQMFFVNTPLKFCFWQITLQAYVIVTFSRVQPSREWVEAQVPEFIRVVIFKSQDDTVTGDECELEDVCQAYVNIITGACISLGK